MSAEKGKKRLDWLDAAKAVALLLVLLSHSMRDEMREASRALDIIYRLAYCFQMPFFFWLTGFTYQLTRKAGANGKALVKRTKRQLLPWAAYTLFIFAVFSAACLIPSLKSC
jgi:fucose 4-O-acetylase-like acetyltransferase